MTGDPGSGEQRLRDLAERLIRHPHPDGPTSAELFVGTLPDSLAFDLPSGDLPLPAGAILLGSRLKRLSGRPASMEAALDGAGEPAAIVAAYVAELKVAGWGTFDGFGPHRGGFVSSDTAEGASLRRGEEGPVLMVSAAARDDEPVDVRVMLNWESVRNLRRAPRAAPPGADLLPRLRAPRGVAVRGSHGGGGENSWTMETTVQTEQRAPELEAHFAAQLEQAGWTRLGGSDDAAVAWSSWQLPGEGGWRGLLLVLAAFGGDERTMTIRVDRRDPDDEARFSAATE